MCMSEFRGKRKCQCKGTHEMILQIQLYRHMQRYMYICMYMCMLYAYVFAYVIVSAFVSAYPLQYLFPDMCRYFLDRYDASGADA